MTSEQKWQNAANGEIGIVEDAGNELSKLVAKRQRELNDLKAQKAEVERLICREFDPDDSADMLEYNRLSSSIESIQASIDLSVMQLSTLDNVRNMLTQLVNSVRILYENKQFKLIVKKIPEKKVAHLVTNPDDIVKLGKLITKLNQVFAIRVDLIREETKRVRTAVGKTAAAGAKGVVSVDAKIDQPKYGAVFKRKSDGNVNPVPVNATNNTNPNNTNPNNTNLA